MRSAAQQLSYPTRQSPKSRVSTAREAYRRWLNVTATPIRGGEHPQQVDVRSAARPDGSPLIEMVKKNIAIPAEAGIGVEFLEYVHSGLAGMRCCHGGNDVSDRQTGILYSRSLIGLEAWVGLQRAYLAPGETSSNRGTNCRLTWHRQPEQPATLRCILRTLRATPSLVSWVEWNPLGT
jgi:hypothetical protein